MINIKDNTRPNIIANIVAHLVEEDSPSESDMILVFSIIVLDELSVMKLVWRKNNASTNFRGGKMLNVNSVIECSLVAFLTIVGLKELQSCY